MLAELETQIGIAERTLAEFIVDVAQGARNVDSFKKVRTPHSCSRASYLPQAYLAMMHRDVK